MNLMKCFASVLRYSNVRTRCSRECKHLNTIILKITDVQISFLLIHRNSRRSIETKCGIASYTVTITCGKKKYKLFKEPKWKL